MNKNLLKYLASLVLFGTNGVLASKTLMASDDIVGSRIALGLITLLLIASAQKILAKSDSSFNLAGAEAVFLSGAAMGLGWVCLFEAYTRIGVGLSTVLYYFGPIIVMALSPLLFKERFSLRKAVCFGVVLLGSILVGGSTLEGGTDPIGILLGLGSAASYAALVIISKKAPGLEGTKRATIQLFGAFMAVALLRVVTGHWSLPEINSEGLPWMVVLGVVNTGLGCYLYFSPLPYLKSQTIAVCGYLEPVSAVVLSALLIGEAMSIPQLIGGLLVIGGAVLFDMSGDIFSRKSRTSRLRRR